MLGQCRLKCVCSVRPCLAPACGTCLGSRAMLPRQAGQVPKDDAGKGGGAEARGHPTIPPTARRKPPTPPSNLVCSQFRPPLLAKAHLDLTGMSPCARESRLQGFQYPWGRHTPLAQPMPRTIRHGTLGGQEVPLHAARLNSGHRRPRVEPRLATPGPADRGRGLVESPRPLPFGRQPRWVQRRSWAILGGERPTAARGSGSVGPGDPSGTSRAVIPVPGPNVPPCHPMKSPRPLHQNPAHW